MKMHNEPPHNFEAEQSVLGALLSDVNYDHCRNALDLISSDVFYSMSHRLIFDTIKTKAEAKEKVDLLTITEHLEKSGKLDQCGGFVYIAELIRNVISKANIMSHVEIIKTSSVMRNVLEMAQNVINQHQTSTPSDLIEFMENRIKDIGFMDTGKSAMHISEVGAQWFDDFSEKERNGGVISGLSTGIEELDSRLSGFDLEGLFILAGRPSMGKTLLAQTIIDNVAGEQQKNCLFFSMEMSGKQVYERFVSKSSTVCPKKIRSANGLDDQDWARLTSGVKRVNDSRIYIHTDAKLTVQQIRARVRRQISMFGSLGLIVIDYLGIMGLPKADRHDIAIGQVTSALKSLAKEIKTPILLIVQGSRASDKAKRPTMGDLKDSSSIEADADVVMFVHREEILNPETELKGVTELIIAKDRHNDGNGTIYLSKVNGGFNSLDQQTVAEMCLREETKSAPSRGYAKK